MLFHILNLLYTVSDSMLVYNNNVILFPCQEVIHRMLKENGPLPFGSGPFSQS
jgi:hypothetical protein